MTTTPALTRREREIARLVAQGLTNAQIADELFIAVATVKIHLTSIYRKLGLKPTRDRGEQRRRLAEWIQEQGARE